jgi:UDP-glucose 4-epimerase
VRVLITGATGLIGRRLVPMLQERGHDVVVLVRPGREGDVDAEPFAHDLMNPLDSSRLPRVECVIHLAAHPHIHFPDHALELYRLNASATLELLEASRRLGVERFVLASTGGVYGFTDKALREDDSTHAHDYYALTKLHGEALVGVYATHFATTVLRPFFPYGPGQQRERLIPRLADTIARGDAVTIREDGGPRLNPIYVDDAAAAVAAASEGRAPAILNIAGLEVVSIAALAEAVGEIVGRATRFELTHDAPAGGLVGDVTRLREVLGEHEFTPLESGLRRALADRASDARQRSASQA